MDHAQVTRSNPEIAVLPSPCHSRKLDANIGTSASETQIIERDSISKYQPPLAAPVSKPIAWVYNPGDGSILLDHKGRPVSVDRILATKPLRGELSTRPGPGGKKLTYISGDGVTRTLNDIFGFDGWNLDITKVEKVDSSKDPSTGKHTIVYTAMVRVTHKASGAYKEDCGAGDSTDKCLATAISHALKASITDAMKRAARHFGDKLGNSLYQGSFSINKAPMTLKDALEKYDVERANAKFGFRKDNIASLQQTHESATIRPSNPEVVATGKENRPDVASFPTNSGMTNDPVLPPKNLASSRRPLPGLETSRDRDIPVQNNGGRFSHQNPVSGPLTSVNEFISSGSGHHLSAPTFQQTRQQQDEMPPPETHPAVPPQTPMDALRNSPLFGYGIQSEGIDKGTSLNQNPLRDAGQSTNLCSTDLQYLSRPPSVNDHRITHPRSNVCCSHEKRAYKNPDPSNYHNSNSNDNRRISVGDGIPTQPALLVTPTGNNAVRHPGFGQHSPLPPNGATSASSSTLSTVHKRPSTAFLNDANFRKTKKIAITAQNPYSTNLMVLKKK